MMKRAFTLKPTMLAVIAALGVTYSPVMFAAGPDTRYITTNETSVFLPQGTHYDLVEITHEGSLTGNTGIRNMGSIVKLNNYGNITVGGFGVYNNGTITELNNYGTMTTTGGNLISNAQGGTLSAINNYGKIQGAGFGTPVLVNWNPSTMGLLTNSGTIAGDITIFPGQGLEIAGGADDTIGVLTGAGSTPSSLEVGNITIEAGNLSFVSGNQLLNNHVNVQAGAVNNERGNLYIANPIEIRGQYYQSGDASLNLFVSSDAITGGVYGQDRGYGQLYVLGAATIAPSSTVNLVSQGYAFAAGQRYVVILATDGAHTNYNETTLHYSATSWNGLIKGTAVADRESQLLVVQLGPDQENSNGGSEGNNPNPDVEDNNGGSEGNNPNPDVKDNNGSKKPLPTQPNATSSLAGLQKYSGVSDAGLLNLYNASLAIGSTAEANKAGEQLSPGQSLNARTAVSTTTFDMLNVVGARVASVQLARNNGGQSGIAAGDAAADSAVWGQVFNGWVNQGTTDKISGYKANYSGLVIGADRNITDEILLGGAVSYTSTNVKGQDNASGSNAYVNSWGLTAYASYKAQDWYSGLYATAVNQDYRTQRQIDFTGYSGIANGKFSGQQYALKGEFGYPLALTQTTNLTPLATLSYSYMRQDGYTETNGNGAALRIERSHSDTLKSGLGAKLETTQTTPWGDVVPYIQVLWGHQYDNKANDVTASYAASVNDTRFVSQGSTPEKDSVDVNVGATLLQSDTTSISAYYDISAAQDYTNQSVSLRLRKLF